VVKAYANALKASERTLMQTLLAHSTIAEDGALRYDTYELVRALHLGADAFSGEDGGRGVLETIRKLAETATALVLDLMDARRGNWEERTGALVRIISGLGRSRLRYAEAMKVLIQLADPAELFGEFTIETHKKIQGEKDLSARYLLNPHNGGGQLRQVVELKAKFAEPSLLSD